ncbi:hypothetical protein H696_06122 [Fonticula alba]|uniref:Cleavage/polyadenylation specificity factor A subunit C-terminal domain-containing protein n=1 Tax=Fonticula alba TaxID=691883 RepID=A0A058YZM2_FONAL|nr:hypothetical protein H696_06122 [Fonticula alba]KCV67430.1 hypothetical protein H696_06122 [Fonticula alba]|eukprot:XP_009498157.1 hypothetical protein H696_06122 [Fonticula alba]
MCRSGVACGLVDVSTAVLLAAGPGVRLLGAPRLVALSAGCAAPAQHFLLHAIHQPVASLDVLFAPAGGPVARALAGWQPADPDGPFYVKHRERVLALRICPRPTVPGIGLRAGPKLALSLDPDPTGRPVSLELCEAPPAVAVAWLETDVKLDEVDRARMHGELLGAPLGAGDMIRLVSPELLARVVRLQGWDFDALPMGRLAPLSDQTLCYVQTAHGPPTHAQQLVLLPAGPHGTDVLMLVPLLMECAPGTLLVSEAAFRRLALGAPLGSLLFACQGGFLAVRPSDEVGRFDVGIHPQDAEQLGLPSAAPLVLERAPRIPPASSATVAFWPAEGVQTLAWAAAGEGTAGFGMLAEGTLLHVAGTGCEGGRPVEDEGRRWLGVELPAETETDTETGTEIVIEAKTKTEIEPPLCLEVVTSPLEGFPEGRAAVSQALYQTLRARLPDSMDLFLQSHDQPLVLFPDPNPRSSLSDGQLIVGRGDVGRIFGHRRVLWAGARASPTHVFQVDLHLALAGGPPVSCVVQSLALGAFLQLLDQSVIFLGQVCHFPAGGTILRGRVARLLDTGLRPVRAGYLDNGHAPVFVHMSVPGRGFRVVGQPESVLLPVPRLAEPIRLPVTTRQFAVYIEAESAQVPEATFLALQRHFLVAGPAIFINQDYRLVPKLKYGLDLEPHHVLVGVGLRRDKRRPLVLRYCQPPDLLLAKCCAVPKEQQQQPPAAVDPGVLTRLLHRSLPEDRAIIKGRLYDTEPGSPDFFLLPNWLGAEGHASVAIGTLVPGLTRLFFETTNTRLAPKPPPALAVHCGQRLLLLDLALVRTGSPLYPGLMLPREVFQSAAESLGGAAPPACLFFVCHGRAFVARLAEVHDVPGVARVCEDLHEHLRPGGALLAHVSRLPEPIGLGTVYLRVSPAVGQQGAGSLAEPRPMQEALLEEALAMAFPDRSMALLERRPFGRCILMPELLLDTDGQEVACGLFRPGETRVHFHFAGAARGGP